MSGSASPATITADHETAATYGLFAIGEACIALPLTAVREVTPCPADLATLPVSAPGLLGALNLRGQVIPVLDLLAMNGAAGPAGGGSRVIVVVLHEGRLAGLVVDGVHGVTAPPALQELGTANALAGQQRLPVSHTFPAPGDGVIVSVLDVEAVFSMPGIPVMLDGRGTGEGAFSGGASHGPDAETVDAADLSGSMLLVRCANHRLAVSIDAVHTIVPRVQVRSSPLAHGACRGVTDYNGTEIPVFDPLELAGLGELSGDDTEGVAVRFQEGLVVMLLSEVLELIPASAAERFDLPAVQVPGCQYLDGVMRVPGRGDFLSLAVSQILRHDDLNALSRMNSRQPGGESGQVPAQRSSDWSRGPDGESEGTARAGGTYLTFSLAPGEKDFAVPLEQVLEILPFPESYSILQDGDQDVLGLFTHRDTVVPLFRLSALIAPQQHDGLIYVLVVTAGPDRGHAAGRAEDAQVVGLAVHALRAIEHSVWEDPAVPDPPAGAEPGEPPTLPEALARRRAIRVTAIGTSDEPRMLSRVDLAAIGGALVPAPSSSTIEVFDGEYADEYDGEYPGDDLDAVGDPIGP
ncbi:chemotaxis protein CheW [Kineosporia sp. J2-2]|uniref:Chemotaxis protein CheW n=1 Tax=Kineosporia corallincola TaxID=2835133 RepID=A0ABS5THN8_9ACTN|nr:chemotaxis protein CheW [Kineosporia corallincola]MBT0770582.1 chemotaxis protein CheW [Kineosporia corallincola]